MPRTSFWIAGLAAALIVGTGAVRADGPEDDAKRLKELIGNSDPETVLAYLQKQVPSDATRAEMARLVRQLGDRAFKVREDAARKLSDAGPVALPALRTAAEDSDPEVSGRAKRCLAAILNGPRADLPAVAARHLVRARHEKAVAALLALYPTADEPLRASLLEGLRTLGVSGQQAHPELVTALDDALADKRSAAVAVLLACDDAEVRKKVRAKLTDPDGGVRFQVALGFLKRGDRAAVPVLIELVADAPSVAAWQHAEELLYEVAGDLAPRVPVGEAKAEDRKKARDVWADWWKQRGEQVLLGRKDDRPTDIAVICDVNEGRVWEWRPEGKPTFELKELNGPVDAHALSGRRYLIAEERASRVSEWSSAGDLLWEKKFDDGPVSCYRLANGNTFVAANTFVTEVRRDGSTVYLYRSDDFHIADAFKMPDGRIACSSNDNKVRILSPGGRELNTFTLESWGGLEALPNGRLLIGQMNGDKLIETDDTGKVVWECKVEGAWYGTRLPDGATLVACKKGNKLVKVGADSKVIWEKELDGAPHCIHWR